MKDRTALLLTFGLVVGPLLVALAVRLWPDRCWERELQDGDPAVRAQAVRDMPHGGNQHLLVAALRDEDADVRLLAVSRVGEAEALVQALKDPHAGVRRQAAEALGWIVPGAWPALRDGMADPDPRVRAGSALAIRCSFQLRKDDPPWSSEELQAIAQALTELLKDDKVEVRKNANRALSAVNEALSRGPR
jgi:HEAT repeat protein